MSKSKPDPPESTHFSDDRLDAGLAAAFGSDAAFSGGTTDGFPASSESRLPTPPGVRLRNAGEDDPVVKSYNVPLNLESTGRYEFLGEIGRGGMGNIFWARDFTLGCELAIKVLAEKYRNVPQARERFVEEAQIAGQLQHPGIVPVHELGEFDDGLPYITMKLVKGLTLARLLAAREDPSQDRPRFLGIFEQICQTLAYAHSRGVIHRDLKPDNVMVGAFGEVQVMDWGLAKVLTQPDFHLASQSQFDQGEAGQTRGSDTTNAETVAETDRSGSTRLATHAGTIMGTPAYISPEQIRGDVDRTDEQSDVFGLGAILCEILSGVPPYVGQNVREVKQRASNVDLTDAFLRLDQCRADHALVSLTKRCLDPAPANRPRHAGVLAEELAAYLQSAQDRLRQTELENVEVRTKASHERKLRLMTVALAATVLLFGTCVAGVWFWVQQDRQNQIAETNKRLQAELKKEKENKAQDVLSFYSGLDMPPDQILPQLEEMVDTSFSDNPFVEAMFRQTMSSTYLSRGEYNLARSNAEKAVELLISAAGSERPVTLAAKKYLRHVQESLYSRPSDPVPRDEALPSVASDLEETVLFSSSYAQAVLADSPVGYWRLNEASGAELARDASTSANHLRYNGTSVTEHGATVFQSKGLGTTDFAQGPVFKFPTSSFSIEFWMKTTAMHDSTIVSYATFQGDDNEVAIDNVGAKGLCVYIGGSGRNSGVYVDDGQWHHIVVTWESWNGAFKLYKDGSLASHGFHSQGKSLFNQGSLVFGQDQDQPGGGFEARSSYQGLLAEVAIYDTVLSAKRIAAHYVSANTLSGGPLQMTATNDPEDNGLDNRLIQTIEAGNSTQMCDFQTIGRPSGQDYADRSRELVTLTAIGTLYHSSGPTDALRDGVSQSNRDSSDESLFFADDTANGCLLMDLGREIPVTKINTYTWHAYSNGFDPDGRAAQRYVLYGSNAATTPATDGEFWTGDEWKVIARVDTDIHFALPNALTRPGQQAVSITSRDEIVANVRYLLWRITPSRRQPLLGEIDVYVRPDSLDPK